MIPCNDWGCWVGQVWPCMSSSLSSCCSRSCCCFMDIPHSLHQPSPTHGEQSCRYSSHRCRLLIPHQNHHQNWHPLPDHIHGAPDHCSPMITSQPAVAAANLTLNDIVLGKDAFEGVDLFNVIGKRGLGVMQLGLEFAMGWCAWRCERLKSGGHLGSRKGGRF